MAALRPAHADAAPHGLHQAALVVVGLLSLVLTTQGNDSAAWLVPSASAWLPATCVASAAACAGLFALVGPASALRAPAPGAPVRAMLRLSALWMACWIGGSMIAAVAAGGWFAYTKGAAPLVGFLLLGPLGEELLFRGAIFELAQRALPASPGAPVLISAVCFSLHHLQLHGYHLSDAALTQMAFTLPMGLVFARLRLWSGSLWPAFALHVLTNLPHAFGS